MGDGDPRNYDLDFSELTRIIFSRVQRIEPENVAKIMGCILLKEPNEVEMIQLAFGPDNILLSKILESKVMLHMMLSKTSIVPYQNLDYVAEEDPYLNLDDQWDPMNHIRNYYYQDATFPSRESRRTSSLLEFPQKTCQYFQKGHCKHGANCRYFHELSPNENNFTDLGKLEMEIIELLRSRKGDPVSITSLPRLYFEKYGRSIHGYSTEGRFSLTKLFARLKNSIRLIDGQHGQHYVILAEDAPRYVECRKDRSDRGSHQIYLTFPAESTFTESDVAYYFEKYGPVRDVRIPLQERRMFGFVSFHYPETVDEILRTRNAHFISGARVLVKQYKENLRTNDRRSLTYSPPHYTEMDHELHSMPRESESSILLKRHFLEEQDKMLELETRLAGVNLLPKQVKEQPNAGYGMEEFTFPEGPDAFPMADHLRYTLDSLIDDSTCDEPTMYTGNEYNDQERQIELPENPFALPLSPGRSSVNSAAHVET